MNNQIEIRNQKVKDFILRYRKSDEKTRKGMDQLGYIESMLFAKFGVFVVLISGGGSTQYFTYGSVISLAIWAAAIFIFLLLWRFDVFHSADKKILFAREIGKGKIMSFHFFFLIVQPSLLHTALAFMCFHVFNNRDNYLRWSQFLSFGEMIVAVLAVVSLKYFCEDIWLKNKDREFAFV